MNMGKNGNNLQTDIERLYHLHYEEMYQLAHSILHDEEEAKDVVSDIFTWLVDHYDEANAFQWNSYLLSSVRNHCQDIIRHRQVKQKAQSYLITESMAETPDDSTNTPDAVEIINYAENNMTAKTKKIFHLRYGENMSYREISHIMGISIPAVYKHILQARHKISARFVGILLALAMMAIAVAMGIKWYHQRQTVSVSSTPLHSTTIIHEEASEQASPSVVVFENENFSHIIQQIASYYQVETSILNKEIGNLRLYFQWNQNESLEQVVKRLNHFHRFHIRIEQNKKLIIE